MSRSIEEQLKEPEMALRVKRTPEGWVIQRIEDGAAHAVSYSTRDKARRAARKIQLGLVRWQQSGRKNYY